MTGEESPLPSPLSGSYVDLARSPLSSSSAWTSSSAETASRAEEAHNSPSAAAGLSNAASSAAKQPQEAAFSEAADLSGVRIGARGRHFVDQDGRVLLMRGVSVSGMNKLPTKPDGRTHLSGGFFDHRNISFLGRPFPLEEADSHFARLKRWGLTLIRLVVCWESLEHAGPGEYDEEYIDYLAALIEKAGRRGMRVIVDAHQDVWSRFTGGSGAPGWTLELAGLEMKNFVPTEAAALHQLGAPLGVWPTGYQKLAAATMFTLFFAGNTFAPKRRVPRRLHRQWARSAGEETMGIQDFLQNSLIEAFARLARRIRHLPCVLGFEPINEPHRGYIELHSPTTWDYNTDLMLHRVPNLLQSLALASGHPQRIDAYKPSWPFPTAKSHQEFVVPPTAIRAWKEGFDCIWREHGVWEWDHVKKQPVFLKAGYFEADPRTGKKFDFYRDAYFGFIRAFAKGVQAMRSDWIVPVGPIPNEFYPQWAAEEQPPNLVAGPHFYDLHSLFTKSHGNMTVNVQGLSRGMPIWKGVYLGWQGAKDNYALQICNIVGSAYRGAGERPCIIGEAGNCLDINSGEALRTGNFYWQTRQMDALMHGMEQSLASFVLWNYNPDNTPTHGDSWNGENFSIYSPATFRALGAVDSPIDDDFGIMTPDALLRPYAAKIAGIPVSTSFDMHTSRFVFAFNNSGSSRSRISEIYLPSSRYPVDKTRVVVSDGTAEYRPELHTLLWTHDGSTDRIHRIAISVDGARSAPFEPFALLQYWWLAAAFIAVALGAYFAV